MSAHSDGGTSSPRRVSNAATSARLTPMFRGRRRQVLYAARLPVPGTAPTFARDQRGVTFPAP